MKRYDETNLPEDIKKSFGNHRQNQIVQKKTYFAAELKLCLIWLGVNAMMSSDIPYVKL